jgi:F-type H+-transporting ATPase subunit epsilon
MSDQMQFELVSPEKLVVSKPVTMITVPGAEGEYGVLVGHAPMITTVKTGVIEVYTDETTVPTERIFVTGGFAEVTQTRCTVLADEAIPVASLNRAKLEEAYRHLSEKLLIVSESEREACLAEQAIIQAKLQAAA